MRRHGFTLIELLIVVAIIAILAAIAVPNFLEAQTRAKVSRTTADMRSLGTALEMYTLDYNRPPTCLTGYNNDASTINGPSLVNSAHPGVGWTSYRFRRLTTPVAYITQVFPDVFAKNGVTKNATWYDAFDYLDDQLDKDRKQAPTNWRGAGLTSGGNWRLASCGPDNFQGFGGSLSGAGGNEKGVDYDASNGTISVGDVVRVGGSGKIVNNKLPAINRVTGTINDPALK